MGNRLDISHHSYNPETGKHESVKVPDFTHKESLSSSFPGDDIVDRLHNANTTFLFLGLSSMFAGGYYAAKAPTNSHAFIGAFICSFVSGKLMDYSERAYAQRLFCDTFPESLDFGEYTRFEVVDNRIDIQSHTQIPGYMKPPIRTGVMYDP